MSFNLSVIVSVDLQELLFPREMLIKIGGLDRNGDVLRFCLAVIAVKLLVYKALLNFFTLFQVRWDETSSVRRPERVSPWEIEPAMASLPLNPHPVPRNKRPRSTLVPSSSDSSVLTREGISLIHMLTTMSSRHLCSNLPFSWDIFRTM